MSDPTVSVLLPVRNAGPYLDACLESLERQTLIDFEVVTVDDGSGDGSGDRLDSWASLKPWLRVLHQPPEGLVAALNRGLAACRGSLVARMDADDISERDRLEQQVGFLVRHPDVAVVGSWYRIVDHDGRQVGERRVPCTDLEIRWMLDFCSPFAHSAVMIRRTSIRPSGSRPDIGSSKKTISGSLMSA